MNDGTISLLIFLKIQICGINTTLLRILQIFNDFLIPLLKVCERRMKIYDFICYSKNKLIISSCVHIQIGEFHFRFILILNK